MFHLKLEKLSMVRLGKYLTEGRNQFLPFIANQLLFFGVSTDNQKRFVT